MPSRMEKYYQTTDVKSRASRNKELYRTIYDEAEYSNVEGISVIEKNEKIDIDMIRELINSANNQKKQKEPVQRVLKPMIEEVEEEKNYDIRDVLDKAKSSRPEPEKKLSNTQYNILKNINLNENINVPQVKDEDLKSMIEAISVNSKGGYTTDLFDDLKSIHDPYMAEKVNEHINEEKEVEIDKSFYTSSFEFTSDDFEDLKDMKESIKTNNMLTKILIFILSVVIVTGIMFLIYHFKG